MSSFKGGGLQLRNKIIVPTPDDKSSIIFVKDGRLKIVGEVEGDLAFTSEITNISGGGSGSATLLENVTPNITVGAIESGQIIPEGTDLTEFIKSVFLKTFPPTITAPSFSLTKSVSNTFEVGTILNNVTLTGNFNRGFIGGVSDNGTWNTSLKQNDRSGAANNYVINSDDVGLDDFLVIPTVNVVESTTTWSATVSYNSGPQPLDSEGNNFGTPLIAGSLNASTSVVGRRRSFHGTNSVTTTPFTNSNQVRQLSGSTMNPSNGTTFNISIPVGSRMVVFAYPATLRQVNSVKYVEFSNSEIKEVFTETSISVEGANGFTPVPYRVYTFIPVEPFSQSVNYSVTI